MDQERQLRLVLEALDRSGPGIGSALRRLRELNKEQERVRKLAGETARAFGNVTGITQFANLAARGFGLLASAMMRVIALAGRLLQAFGSAIGAAIQAVMRLAQAIGGALWGAASRVFGFMATTAKVAVVGLTAAMGLLARQGIAVHTSFTAAERGLALLLKSSTAAKQVMAALRQEAEQSAFELVPLAEMAQRLAAFGFAAQDIVPMIRTLGDVAAGLGGGQPMIDRLMIALGQIKAKGILSGEEAMQLTEAGINVRQILGIPQGMDIAKAGISADDAIPRLLAGMERTFGGMQAGAMQDLPGILSNIKDAIDRITASVTGGLNESLKRAAAYVLEFLGNLEKTAAGRTLLNALRQAFDTVGKAIEALVARLPSLVEWLANLLQSDRLAEFRDRAIDAFQKLWGAAQKVVKWLAENWPAIWETIKSTTIVGVKVIGGALAGVWNVFKELAEGQNLWAANWREVLSNAVDAVRGFAMHTTHAVFQAIRAVLKLADSWAVMWAALTSNDIMTLIAKMGAVAYVRLRYQDIQGAIDQAEIAVMNRLEKLDLRKTLAAAQAGGGVLQQMAQRQDILGSFARGAQGWIQGVDQWWSRAFSGGRTRERTISGIIAGLGGLPEVEAPAATGGRYWPDLPPLTFGDTAAQQARAEKADYQKQMTSLEMLDAQIAYIRQVMANQPGMLEAMTSGYLVPALQQRIQLLQSLPFDPNKDAGVAWWERAGEIEQTRGAILAAQDAVRKAAEEQARAAEEQARAAERQALTAMATPASGREPSAFEMLYGAPVEGPPVAFGVSAAPTARATTGGGTTLIFNLPTSDPGAVAQEVYRVLDELQRRASGW